MKNSMTSSKKKVTFDDPREVYHSINEKNNSLAASNAVLRKDPSKLGKESLGMNPNLRIENEYIENLLKQVHFMNMEINLMKEKLTEDEVKLGPSWMISGMKDPHTKHIVVTHDKFKEMKLLMDGLEFDEKLKYHHIVNDNTKLQASKDHAEQLFEEQNDKLNNLVEACEKKASELKDELNKERAARENIENEVKGIKGKYERALEDHKKLTKEKRLRDLHNRLMQEEHDYDLKRDLDAIAHLDTELAKQTKEKDLLLEKINTDPKLVALKEKQAQLKKSIEQKEKELNEEKYKVTELETQVTLSIRHKEQEAEDRRRLLQEIEKLKDLLEDTTKANNMKVQRKFKEFDSPELAALQGQMMKLEREAKEIEGKMDNVYNKVKAEEEDYENKHNVLNNWTDQNSKLQKEHNDNSKVITELGPQVAKLKEDLERNNKRLEDLMRERIEARLILDSLKDQNQLMSASNEYLSKNLDVDEVLNGINIREFEGLMQTNSDVNATVKNLFSTWDTIKRFAKEQ